MSRLDFVSQEAAFDFLDTYAEARKQEIDRRRLSKDSGFIKSYSLETSATASDFSSAHHTVERQFDAFGWRLTPVGDNGFFHINSGTEFIGFADFFSVRHIAVHTFNEARRMDKTIRNLVKESSQLDFIWLAGNYLNLIWENLVRDYMENRFVTFKFEHLGRFEELGWEQTDDTEIDEDDYDIGGDEEIEIPERRASALKVTHRVSQVAEFLPKLQEILPDFKAIKMLRIPATDLPGGYEFWDWGKVTYRSPSFRDGRDYLREITQLYQKATELIEQRVWFQIERTHIGTDIDRVSITGTPVTFTFDPPLNLATFQNFVDTTFERGQGPLRLWGNPVRLSEKKVLVHGIDLHLWKKVYLELTPARFIVILPTGTCGNTIHRLVSNIQRFISPEVKTYIGDYRYEDLVRDVLLNRVNADD